MRVVGDIIYFEVPGRPILVLNSLEDAEDLLGKRANVWSARPESYMVFNLYVIWNSCGDSDLLPHYSWIHFAKDGVHVGPSLSSTRLGSQ